MTPMPAPTAEPQVADSIKNQGCAGSSRAEDTHVLLRSIRDRHGKVLHPTFGGGTSVHRKAVPDGSVRKIESGSGFSIDSIPELTGLSTYEQG